MWRRFWTALKELLTPGGYTRRYNRYYNQMTGDNPPTTYQPIPPRSHRKSSTAAKMKRTRSSLRKWTQAVKRLNRGFHAKGAPRGRKY
jgi:hypothetical protein